MDLRITVSCPDSHWCPGSDQSLSSYETKGWPSKSPSERFTNGSQKTRWGSQLFSWAAGRKTPLWQEMRPMKEKQKQGGVLMNRIILDINGAHRWSSSYIRQEIPIPFLCKPPPPILRHQKRTGTSKRKASSLSNTTLNKNFLSKAPLEILSAVSHTRTVVHSSII